MGIMRKTLVSRLRSELNMPVWETHGYITKYRREKYGTSPAPVRVQDCDQFDDMTMLCFRYLGPAQ